MIQIYDANRQRTHIAYWPRISKTDPIYGKFPDFIFTFSFKKEHVKYPEITEIMVVFSNKIAVQRDGHYLNIDGKIFRYDDILKYWEKVEALIKQEYNTQAIEALP
jgi:hypothetical protein